MITTIQQPRTVLADIDSTVEAQGGNDAIDWGGIDIDVDNDPMLALDYLKDIESNRKRSALETTLRAHDRVAKAESQRMQQQQPALLVGNSSGYNYKSFNLIHGLSFGSGCRCCYDPHGDGGDYELLAEAKKGREAMQQRRAYDDDEYEDNEFSKIDNIDENSDSDSEFDYLLDEDLPSSTNDMQAQRRAELELLAKHHEVVRYHGYGVHRQMHPQRVFASVGYGSTASDRGGVSPKAAVLHLYDAFSPLSVSLDLCLEDMAGRYPGTKFVRSLGITSILYAEDTSSSQDWKRGDMPMLLALKYGKVVAWSSGLKEFHNASDNEHVEQRALEQWLDYAGVLIDAPPPMEEVCRIRPEEEMLLENMMKLNGMGINGDIGGERAEMGRKEKDEDFEERFDCGVEGCGKSFYHEHVGVKTDMQDGLMVSESQVSSADGL